MEPFIGSKCFLSLSLFILTVLTIYGIIGLVLNFFRASRLANFGDWPFNPHPVLYAFIGIQSLFPVAGLFALLAVWKKNPLFIYGSGSALLAVFTCSSVFGTVAYRHTTTDIMDGFFSALKEHSNDKDVLNWMNDMQWKHKCCGVYSYADYWSIKANEEVVPFEGVPSSCCRREGKVPTKTCGKRLLLSDEANAIPAEQRIYTEGCGQIVAESLSGTLKWIGIEIWTVGAVSLLVAIFLYVGITKLYLTPPIPTPTTSNDGGNRASGTDGGRGDASRRGSRRGKRSLGGSGIDLENNNSASISGSGFAQSATTGIKLGISGKRRRVNRRKAKPTKFGFGIGGPRRMSVNNNGSLAKRDANISKSFILGEANSQLISVLGEGGGSHDEELFRKNIDMLWYQSLEKNMSALSTTPTDISSMNFPVNVHSKKPAAGMSPELMSAINEERNTVYTLVSERPFTPSLSQNCSISFFNSYPIKFGPPNGAGAMAEGPPNGQNSPVNSTSRQQRPSLHANSLKIDDDFPITIAEERVEEIMELAAAPPPPPPTPAMMIPTPSTTTKLTAKSESSDGKNDNSPPEAVIIPEDDENSSSSESLISQINAVAAPSCPPPQANVKFPMSSVRSSTLATIQEESESAKGTPANQKGAASPSSSYNSPQNASPSTTETELHPPPPDHEDNHQDEQQPAAITNAMNDSNDIDNNAVVSQCPNNQEIAQNSDPAAVAGGEAGTVGTSSSASAEKLTTTTANNVNPSLTIAIGVGQEAFFEYSSQEAFQTLDINSNVVSKEKFPQRGEELTAELSF